MSTEHPGRRVLLGALAFGWVPTAQLLGSRPSLLPAGKSIYRLVGHVTVNHVVATLETILRTGDTIVTGKASEIVFCVGTCAMILRAESTLILGPPKPDEPFLVRALKCIRGALLTVSRDTAIVLETPTAHVGVRGTGFYTEARPDETYFCTCYGVTDIASVSRPEARETITARHHDRPVYILKDAAGGRNIRNAPFINHTDEELTLIEALVGRTPPFVFAKESYGGPRRDY